MKKVFSIAFLVIFLSTYLKPYLPYLDYYFNKEYIAENLCENKDKPALKCHGQCHLKKQIEKVAEKEQQPPFSPSNGNKQKNERQLNLFLEVIEPIGPFTEKTQHIYAYHGMHSDFSLKITLPPPQTPEIRPEALWA